MVHNHKIITIEMLDALALGAGYLGSGGGGDTFNERLVARYALEKYGPVKIITVNDLLDTDFIIPVAYAGAPLVGMERIATGQEFVECVAEITRVFGKQPTAVMSGEVGGGNIFSGITAAACLGLPLLDGDLIGRAFPELHMSSASLYNIAASPAVMSNGYGALITVQALHNAQFEVIARSIIVSLGSSAAIALYGMMGSVARHAVVADTISQAYSLGAAVLAARSCGKDPVKAFLDHTKAQCCIRGTITAITQKIERGFLVGAFEITNGTETACVEYQNENLCVRYNNDLYATTPDCIIPLDIHTAAPIMTGSLRYGLSVALMVFDAPALWKTPEGLKLVGPRVFGYDVDYTSVVKG